MNLLGTRDQQLRDHYYSASGTITTGGTSQLLLPERKSTSMLIIQNNSSGAMYIEFGGARATASLSGNGVASCTITNGGFGYKLPPIVRFWGGGNGGNTIWNGVGMPNWPAPGDEAFAQPRAPSGGGRVAVGQATINGSGVVTGITITDPGAGYVAAPYVFLENNLLDPFGAADPYYGSVNSGLQLPNSGANYYINGTHCTTDAISIWGASTSQAFTCFWAP